MYDEQDRLLDERIGCRTICIGYRTRRIVCRTSRTGSRTSN
jgi:hypothetical protein